MAPEGWREVTLGRVVDGGFRSDHSPIAPAEKNIRFVLSLEALTPNGLYVAADKIAENGFNLNIPRYVDTFEEEAEIGLMAFWAERRELASETVDLETRMAVCLKELCYGA